MGSPKVGLFNFKNCYLLKKNPFRDAMTELGQELGNSLKNVNYETSLEYHCKVVIIAQKRQTCLHFLVFSIRQVSLHP